jgi:GIY-YIG catalytic domain
VMGAYKATYIYYLSDPRTSQVRYVGKSRDPLTRLNHHVASRVNYSNPFQRWMAELISNGLQPQLTVLEKIPENREEDFEAKWILHYRVQGCDLFNVSGGSGLLVVKHSESAREKIRKARKGMTFPQSHRDNISKAKKQFYAEHPEAVDKARRRYNHLSDEEAIRLKQLATEGNISQSELSRMFNIGQSIVSEIKNGKRYKHLADIEARLAKRNGKKEAP